MEEFGAHYFNKQNLQKTHKRPFHCFSLVNGLPPVSSHDIYLAIEVQKGDQQEIDGNLEVLGGTHDRA